MCSFKTGGIGLLAGLTLTALAGPLMTDSEAGVIAYSTLQITNFAVTEGGELIQSIAGAHNGTSSRAAFDGQPGISWSDPSDAQMSCLGACGGVGENSWARYSDGNPGAHISRGNSLLTGSLLEAGGANAYTVAETQLTNPGGSNAGGEISSTASVMTAEFMMTEPEVTLSFSVLGELYVDSDAADGFGQAGFNWSLSLLDAITSEEIYDVTDEDFADDLDQSVAVTGVGSESYGIDDSFDLTITGLEAGRTYRLLIAHHSDVEASLPVPATLGVMGAGLFGIGAVVRRRRRAS